ncbi:hypothetical protein F3Y22_tig00110202pilonHSYRG00064 [Hibiscus syriacus]|uniref:Uncharacterized protein n=1 Tax=Hibiscus syriacus TaxID=106335 RepID=A0A6A3BD98_HIBSY|nr:hypothetical protein F3Y22_tig00110202pilonHSYRG00064 [Hibiscus syriacus]
MFGNLRYFKLKGTKNKEVLVPNRNECLKKPFAGIKVLVSSLSHGGKRVYCWLDARSHCRFSGVCLLVWYGKKKAKVCGSKTFAFSLFCLSEYIQREIDFGKVRGVSPLSITLEACTIGPHSEEFSCGEIPSIKIRVRPFASLRRGKIVIDAVCLIQVFIAQKKDYSWLGIPISENGLRKHLSTEEGIDYRTKSRRLPERNQPFSGLERGIMMLGKQQRWDTLFRRSDTSAGVAAKRHILERSASAAVAFPGAGTSVDISTAEGSLLNYNQKMEHVSGYVKFQNHYGHVHVQLSGNCKTWRSGLVSEDGGWLSTDVFVNILDQKWHAKLNISNLFVPLFERILEIPITWLKGRVTGEVHLCMSRGETFPNLHGQLDATGLAFQVYDSPSCFSDLSASLCFRGQRIFLHNTSGWFGSVPLEASGYFGIHPEEGEFHLMCQVPSVEVNALMRTFKMKPLSFPLAGSVTAVFNCQGPLTAPTFVGSGMVSRKISYSDFDVPSSSASEAILKNKEAGAVAAFDCIPLSYLSANFTFNSDNCVVDLYGIRASLADGGEIRGAGNIWICPEGEEDNTAMDVNFSGNLSIDKIMQRYIPGYVHLMPLKLGDLSGETKLSGSLLKPRFDIKWTAPKAEGSLSDARGDVMISPDCITVNSSSAAFDLSTKVQTSYPEEYWRNIKEINEKISVPFIIEGVELDLRMRGFEFFNLVSSYTFDPPRSTHLKATGKIKFHGKVLKPSIICEKELCPDRQPEKVMDNRSKHSLVGELSVSGLRLNQLMLAPQLVGQLSISRDSIKNSMKREADDRRLWMEVNKPLRGDKGGYEEEIELSRSLRDGRTYKDVLNEGNSFRLEQEIGENRGGVIKYSFEPEEVKKALGKEGFDVKVVRWGYVGEFICIPDETRNREDLTSARIFIRVVSPFDVPDFINIGSYGRSFKVKIKLGSKCKNVPVVIGDELQTNSDEFYSDDFSKEEDGGNSKTNNDHCGTSTEVVRSKVITWLEQGKESGLHEVETNHERDYAGLGLRQDVDSNKSAQSDSKWDFSSSEQKTIPAGPTFNLKWDGSKNKNKFRLVSNRNEDERGITTEEKTEGYNQLEAYSFDMKPNSKLQKEENIEVNLTIPQQWNSVYPISSCLSIKSARDGRRKRGRFARVYRRSSDRRVWLCSGIEQINMHLEVNPIQDKKKTDAGNFQQLSITNGGREHELINKVIGKDHRKRRTLINEALDLVTNSTVSSTIFSMLLEEAMATLDVCQMLGISFKDGK